MRQISLEELLEAGCHFGHQVTRGNPKARDFVFEARDNIQIIDLVKTKEGLEEAGEFVKTLGQKGDSLLIVGTKRQAREIIEKEIAKAREAIALLNKSTPQRLFYITQRWIGGILTNFSEVSKNFQKINDLTKQTTDKDEKAKYTKKEIGQFDKEKLKLESFYKGVMEMPPKPGALFIVDSHLEDLAVKEAGSVNVQTVAIVDTNADPYLIDYPIPANDDAVGSIQLIVSYIIDAYVEGIKAYKPAEQAKPPVANPPKETAPASTAEETSAVEPNTQEEASKPAVSESTEKPAEVTESKSKVKAQKSKVKAKVK